MNPHNPTEQELETALSSAEENSFKTAFKNQSTRPQALHDIATYFIEKYHVKTIGGEKVRELFMYKDGIYVEGVNILRSELRGILEELCTNRLINEIIEAVKDRTIFDRQDFVVDTNFINLINGVFDVSKHELLSHDPKYLFFTKLPIHYEKTTDCPAIKKFLNEILDEETIIVMQEWFGFGLYRQYFIKKGIIFVGEGDTGKTTLLRLYDKFYGPENVTGVSLQKVSSDKFATASLYNKHLNTYDDLPSNDIKDNGNFKMVTGGGSITGEFKFKNQFKFENFAKLMFACNKIPDVKDSNDDAYFDRWIVIQFNNIVSKEKKDPFLIGKMTTTEEISGLFNFALEGLNRLLLNNKFSYDKDADEIKIEMMRSGSGIANFVYDELEEYEGGQITKDGMHSAYNKYARENKLPSATLKNMGKLPKYASYISDVRPMNYVTKKQSTAMVWGNVRFKDGSKFKDDFDDIQTEQKEEEGSESLSLGLTS